MSYATRALAVASALLMGAPTAAFADTISNTDFEGGSLSGWNIGSQTGTLTNGTITGNGTGVTLINGSVTFSAPSHPAVGSPTLSDGSPNPYYQPAVSPTTWTFAPYGSYGAALQPTGSVTFDDATSALGLTQTQNQEIKTKLIQDQQASGLGNPTPTNAAWFTANVNLDAGKIYTMSWNYIGTDYVPFNDGSITSLVYQGTGSTPNIVVNNYTSNYALLGFTNPGTGDYSTGTYGSTGWQTSTYEVSLSGSYLLGFAVFNLGDTSLSPVLLVDSEPGTTLANGQTFNPVAPNNATAPSASTTPPTPTITGTTTTDQVVSTTTTGSISATSQVTYSVNNLDANGFGTVQNYTDTIVTTTPVTTTTTTTTPVTVTTYSDGSTTTSNGTPVVTTSTSNGTSTSQVTGTILNFTSVIAPSVSYDTVASGSPTITNTPTFNTTENDGKQKVNVHVKTDIATPLLTTVTTTPIITTTDANGNVTITEGIPVETYVSSTSYEEVHSYKDLYGRVDQLEVLDGINDGINGLLNHEPSNTKERLRVFENNRFVQSYNADGYTADSKIFGGGFEFDVTKGWVVGFQYNRININLNGVDSSTQQTKDHFGVFSELRGNTFTLNTNAAIANSNYKYNRTVEGIFNNAGETTGNEWWISNRLYWHLHKTIKPFVGYTVQNVKRNAYTETGSPESARSVSAFNQTTHVGEAGLKLETRFGSKKKDLFGVSVEGAYGTDSSYGVTAAVDYKEMLFIEGSHGVNNGVTNNSVAAKVKFRF
jgi:hypothetical protein